MSKCRLRLGLLSLAVCLPAAAQAPAIAPNGILNAADYTRDIAPGSMVAIFGSNLAPRTTAAAAVPLPKSLEGVAVEVQDTSGVWAPVPLYFVSPGQINVQFPFTSPGSVQVRIRIGPAYSAPASVPLAARAPRIFTKSMDGKGEPTLFHARDFSWVSAANPAAPGEYLVLLLTGLGAVSPAKEAGAPGGDNAANGPINYITDPVFLTFGGQETRAAFAGLMPGFPGVYQINFQVPDTVPAGVQALQVRTGQAASQANVAAACARSSTPGAVSATITPSGGKLESPGISLTVPPGAFPEPATLSLAPKPTATPVDDFRASGVFSLQGLPATRNAPLTLTLDLSQREAQDETLVALVSGPSVRGAGLEFLEAAVANGKATVTIPPSAEADPPKALTPAIESGPEVTLYVMTFYRRVHIGDFLLFFPASQILESDVQEIAVTLAAAKQRLQSFGLNWSRRTRWPLRVVIYPFAAEDAAKWGMAEPSILGVNYHSISLNANKLTGGVSTEWRASIAHELFHIQQNLYDPRDAFRIAKSPGPWLWFQEAASTWFESVFTNDREAVPSIVSNDNYAFLTKHGLEYQPGDPGAVQDHGYGASMFLHFLTAKPGGDATIGDILKQGESRATGIIPNPARWPVEGASTVLRGMISEYWREFVVKYTEGELYGGRFPGHNEILSQLKDRYAFSETTTPGKTFSWDAPALSAAYYLVRVPAWPKDVKMTVSLADPGGEAQLSVYRTKGDTWTLVTRMRAGEFDFPKPEDLVANGESLLLAVANANGSGRYTAATNLQIGVNKAVDSILPFLRLMPKFKSQINAVITWSNQPASPSLAGTFFGLPGLSWPGGAAFSATANDSALVNASDPPFATTLTGTLSPDGQTIVSAHYKRTRLIDKTYKDAANNTFRTYQDEIMEWDIVNLPVVVPSRGFSSATDSFLYQKKGAAAAATLTNFNCRKLYYSGSASGFSPSKITTLTCTVAFPADDRYYNEITFFK